MFHVSDFAREFYVYIIYAFVIFPSELHVQPIVISTIFVTDQNSSLSDTFC